MFFPIGDEPNLPGRPTVTYVLMGINIVAFVLCWLTMMHSAPSGDDPRFFEYLQIVLGDLARGLHTTPGELITNARAFGPQIKAEVDATIASVSVYELFVFEYGFKPAAPSVTDLFVSMFLHGGWMHLAGNMLYLWIFGDNVELHIGKRAYLFLYLATGVCAVVLHAAFSMNSMMPMVGASGAISGVLGCYFLWFPENRVKMLVWLLYFVQVFRIPARWVLGFYLVYDNLLPFLFISASSGVAHGAHIGGFLGGLGGAVALNKLAERRTSAARPTSDNSIPMDRSRQNAGKVFSDAIASGNWTAALSLYTEMPMRDRLDLVDAEVLVLADWLVANGQLAAGLAVLQRFISTHPRSPLLARAHLRAGMIHLREQRLPTAYQHFHIVLDLEATAEEVAGARTGLAEVERRQRRAESSRLH